MVLDLLYKKKHSKEEDEQRRHVADLLDLALGQRSKIYIKFDDEATNLTDISGTLVDIKGSSLLVELSGVSTLKDRFIGQKITCFFKIVEREHRHREVFYSFATTIERIRQQGERLPLVTLAFPSSLDGTQRRKSLRMKPDLEQFSHISLWKYDASGGFDIAKPTVAHGFFKNSQASIENISAGGLRVILRRSIMKDHCPDLKKGDRFILYVSFAEKLQKLREEYWLVAKINNFQLDAISGDVTLGMEFVANGARLPDSSKVEWSKIEDNIIDDIAQRIYQWHLLLYRDKGIL